MNNRRPTKDDGCCSVHFLKYLLFIFNFLFYLAGLTILGVGLWTLLFKSEYAPLLSSTYQITTYILIGAGVLVILVGILGCVGVLRENRCCLLLFTFLLLLIFLVEAVAGVLAYIYSEQVGQELEKNLRNTIVQQYTTDPQVGEAIEKLHLEHYCCGAASDRDWEDSGWSKEANSPEAVGNRTGERLLSVPDFCCISPSKDCGWRHHPSNIHVTGCMTALKTEIQEQEIIIGAVALGISTIQIFGMVVSCCLYVKLKDFEDLKNRRRNDMYY